MHFYVCMHGAVFIGVGVWVGGGVYVCGCGCMGVCGYVCVCCVRVCVGGVGDVVCKCGVHFNGDHCLDMLLSLQHVCVF